MKKTKQNKYWTLSIIFLFMASIQSYGQACTFDDPQKQAEYDAIIDLVNANTGLETWAEELIEADCDLCNIGTCNSNGYLTILNLDFRITTIPESIGNLIFLQELSFSDNLISVIPESIGNLSNLEILNFSENLNIASVPESIGNLSNLRELRLDRNQITSLPSSIGNLNNLEILVLVLNQLTSLPSSIGNLSSLRILDLENNQLTSIPESIGNLSSLQKLSLRSNQLTSIPEIIGNLSSLQVINFGSNDLTSVPSSIGNLSSLQVIDFVSNDLTSIPESIGNLSSLQKLTIGVNPLTSLPSSIGNLSSLQELRIFRTTLSTLPESIVNLSNLTVLSLRENQLTSIPENIGALSNLESLTLFSNQLTRLPGSIFQLRNLTRFEVFDNQISCLPSEAVEACSFFTFFTFSGNPIFAQYSRFEDFCANPIAGICEDDCICTQEFNPVCGADGVTYSNACFAMCAGVTYTNGECGDSGGDPYLTGNTGNETCTVWIDSDNDGVCDDADICEGGDDYIDINQNGIPDACDGLDPPGGDPYLTGNTGNEICSVWIDSDNDGVCDDADICEGGDDYIDTNQNGIPDACDGIDPPGGDPFLTGNTGNETCSVWIDSDNDGVCDDADICEGGDDYIDIDQNGIPDACDDASGGGDPFLTGNTGNETCSVWIDSDGDGVCDDADICEGGDDYIDTDSDGIPDACDTNVLTRIAQPERLIAEKTAGRKVNLTWAANEINAITQYTIQHSTDGQQYQNLITKTPKASGEIEVYYDVHTTPALGNNFYRLQIDYQEKNSEYFEGDPIYFIPTGIAAFPNPTKDILHVNLSEIMGTSVIIKLHTIQGVELETIEIDANHEEVVILDIRPYNNGLYTLMIQLDDFRAISQKVVISNTY